MFKKKNPLTFHQEPTHYNGQRLRDFVFGFSDGMVTTLAIISALSAAAVGNTLIIFAGIANVIADAISMALGGYISSKSQIEVYKNAERKEKMEMEEVPDIEREEIREIYRQKGFSGKLLEDVVKKITSNKKVWLEVMMHDELGLSRDVLNEKPNIVGLTIFAGFVIAGFVPVIPYLFLPVTEAFQVAVPLAFISLFVMGSLRSIFTGRSWLKSGLEVLAIGLLATAAAYFVGSLVPQMQSTI